MAKELMTKGKVDPRGWVSQLTFQPTEPMYFPAVLERDEEAQNMLGDVLALF